MKYLLRVLSRMTGESLLPCLGQIAYLVQSGLFHRVSLDVGPQETDGLWARGRVRKRRNCQAPLLGGQGPGGGSPSLGPASSAAHSQPAGPQHLRPAEQRRYKWGSRQPRVHTFDPKLQGEERGPGMCILQTYPRGLWPRYFHSPKSSTLL